MYFPYVSAYVPTEPRLLDVLHHFFFLLFFLSFSEKHSRPSPKYRNLFFCSLHVVLLETRVIKPTFNRLIPTIFSSPLKITCAKIQISYTVLAAFNENNLPPFF